MAFRNTRIKIQVKAQGLYEFNYKAKCEQVLNRVKRVCSHPCPQLEQGKKVLNVNFPQTAHTEALIFKGFFKSLELKREFGSSSQKLTPLTHPLVRGVSF